MRVKWSELSGMERDALVAEHVMGWTHSEDGSFWITPTGGLVDVVEFDPSQRIERAWQVVEKLAASLNGPGATIGVSKMLDREGEPEGWRCDFILETSNPLPGHLNDEELNRRISEWLDEEPRARIWTNVKASTAPEAICIAALRAVGVEVED